MSEREAAPDTAGTATVSGMNVVSASAWMTAARIIAQATSLVLLLAAARYLTPAELGSFVLCSAIAILLTRVAEAGWPQYAMAWPKAGDPPPTVLWCALLAGAIMTGVGVTIGAIAIFWFDDDTYGNLLLLLFLTVLPGTFVTLQQGILTRRQAISGISKIAITANLAGLAAGLAALAGGWGVFALAADKLVAVFVSTLGTLFVARWIPAFEFDRRRAKEVAVYASHIVASRMISFGHNYGAEFLIAIFLGTTEVGLYRAGARVVGSINEILLEPARVIAWAMLSRAKQSGTTPGTVAGEIASTLVYIAMPIFVGLALVSNSIPQILFGKGWELAGPVIALLAIARLFSLVGSLGEPMLAVAGRTSLIPRLSILGLILSWASLALMAPGGLVWAAASQLLAAAIYIPITGLILVRYAAFAWKPLFAGAGAAAIGTALMAAAVYTVKTADGAAIDSITALLAIQTMVGGATYIALTKFLRPELFSSVVKALAAKRPAKDKARQAS